MSAAVELALIYGNDLTVAPNGDLLLSFDAPPPGYTTAPTPAITLVPGAPEATLERVLRIVMTNPTTYDLNNNPIGPPDYDEHPQFGSGVRASIGENNTPALVQGIQNRIQAALALDPFIQSQPPPSVTWTQVAIGTYNLVVSAYSIVGQLFTLPTIQITQSGASVVGA